MTQSTVAGSPVHSPAPARNPAPGASPSLPLIRVEPPSGWPTLGFGELWAYRGLFYFLVWRDLKVRYAQSVLGAGWAIIQPLVTMVVFTVIFGNFANIPSDGIPYPVFSLAALVPWTYFSQSLTNASNSLTASANLLTKVYFPRLIIPLATILSGLGNFLIAFLILLVVQLSYGITPSAWAVLLIPLLLLVMMMTAAGVGCWLAALQVQYRDVRPITGFAVQIWMYAAPVVYPLSLVPERFQTLYMLNPLVGVVEGFRAVLLDAQPVNWPALGLAVVVSFILFFSGLLFFRRMEDRFADVV
jgi:lipopolysaccharide transport system permease protein